LARIAVGNADAAIYNRVAWFYAQHHIEPAAAVRLARRAAELKPGEANIQDTLGCALLRHGESQEALSWFVQAIEGGDLDSSWSGLYELAQTDTRVAQRHVGQHQSHIGGPNKRRILMEPLVGDRRVGARATAGKELHGGPNADRLTDRLTFTAFQRGNGGKVTSFTHHLLPSVKDGG
jgi:hypothetical protein